MSGVIFTVLGLLIGIMLLGAGLYYRAKEKSDPESRKIYTVTALIGAVIVIGVVLKILAVGI